jgi:hypothetical protein
MLQFGYNGGLPQGTSTAWGCRAIVDVEGRVDVPPDRQHGVGPRIDVLLDYLNNHVRGVWRERAAELLRAGVLNPRGPSAVVLYHDDRIMIKGNTQSSGGYLYVCAYLLDEGTER